MFVSDLMDVID